MSAGTTPRQDEISTTQSSNPAPRAAKLRLWPAVVLLAIFWAILYANHHVEMWMFPRFISRLVAYGILLLTFSGWWLTRSAISWRDRLLAIVFVIVTGAAACLVADKSLIWPMLFMNAFPFVFTLGTAWLLVARLFTPPVQRAGFCVATLLAFGYFTLIRFDGLDAAQRAEMSWRWSEKSEHVFLATHGAAAAIPALEADAPSKPWTPQPGDSLEYRGPQRDGAISGVLVDTDWSAHTPKLLWREKVGPAWSGLIVVDGHIVTQEQRDTVEAVVCYDAATGKEFWAHEDSVRFEEALSGAGPRGTPTFADGRIYACGAKGTLCCLVAETGAVVWSHDVVVDAGVAPADIPQWGYSVSPLVVDGLVVVFAGGGEDKSILAYRASDGKLAWSRAGGKQSYSSPQLATLDGQKQIVMHDSRALVGLNVADGAVLWEYLNRNGMSLPMLQPHATDSDKLVISMSGSATMLEVKRADGKSTVAPRWTANTFKPDFNDFVIHKGCAYALSDGVLCCLDLETGERLWKKGRLGHGQMLLLADQDMLLVSSEKGEIILVSVSRDGYQELGRFQAIEGKTWNGPVLAGGRLFLRNAAEMAAFKVKLQKPPADQSKAGKSLAVSLHDAPARGDTSATPR